jgi:hypothetical protein
VKIRILERYALSEIPSASGLEILGDYHYVLSDDSPFLFCIDEKGQSKFRLRIKDSFEMRNGRIPKKIKPDFESLSQLRLQGQEHLLLLGSGSAPLRHFALLFNTALFTQTPIELEPLYAHLQSHLQPGSLNIEALAANETHLFFFQRGNVSGENTIFRCLQSDFIAYIQNIEQIPAFDIFDFELPTFEGVQAGFSGAAWLPERGYLLFAASLEDTQDAIADGVVLGSMIGLIDLDENAPRIKQELLTEANGSIYRGKVESVAYWRASGPDSFLAKAVTDSDGGHSELLVLEISYN